MFFKTVLSLFLLLAALGAEAGTSCPNAEILGPKIISNMCWKCVMPIRIAGKTLADSDDSFVPDNAAKKNVCVCKDNAGMPHVGLLTSFWEPYRLIEFERTPGCLSVLNGTQLNYNPLMRGRHGSGIKGRKETIFTHYHYYSYPLMYLLDLYTGKGCNPGGYSDLDLMFMSELDPTWGDAELSLFANPEALLFANPAGVVACIPDALATLSGNPIDALFWCAGTWGQIYPINGHLPDDNGVLKATSLGSVRVLTQLHRRGFAWKTVGDDAMCGGELSPIFPKSQYKFTSAWPVADTELSRRVGELVELWGANKLLPAAGEDPVYVVWRWLDCCNRF